MKKQNNPLTILTLALAMVIIIACTKENGVTNGSEVPSDTTAVATSSSGVAKDSSSSANGTSSSSSSSSEPCKEGTWLEKGKDKYICKNGVWEKFILSSSSKVPSSSSIAPDTTGPIRYNMDSLFAGINEKKSTYSNFTDPRDGQVYKTVTMNFGLLGNWEYFAENLNYGRQVNLKEGKTLTDSTKYCYDDDPWYCDNHFGGLYTWSLAMGFPSACDTLALGSSPECPDTIYYNPTPGYGPGSAQIQGICPVGWHVMNQHDFVETLFATNAASTIQSWVGWNKTGNSSGFSALPGGGI